MIKKFLILTFTLVSIESYCSNRDTTSFKNSFAINLEALIVRDIKLTNTHRLNKRMYFETSLSYNIPYNQDNSFLTNDILSIVNLQDPFYYYGRIQLRLGLKRYAIKQNSLKRFYSEPMLLYSYGHFNKSVAFFRNLNNNVVSSTVTRSKNDVELLYKFGWTFHKRNFFQDLYFGAGIRVKFINDIDYEDFGDDATPMWLPNQTYPYHDNFIHVSFEFHLGYQIGICK